MTPKNRATLISPSKAFKAGHGDVIVSDEADAPRGTCFALFNFSAKSANRTGSSCSSISVLSDATSYSQSSLTPWDEGGWTLDGHKLLASPRLSPGCSWTGSPSAGTGTLRGVVRKAHVSSTF